MEQGQMVFSKNTFVTTWCLACDSVAWCGSPLLFLIHKTHQFSNTILTMVAAPTPNKLAVGIKYLMQTWSTAYWIWMKFLPYQWWQGKIEESWWWLKWTMGLTEFGSNIKFGLKNVASIFLWEAMLETRALTPVERTATKVPIQRFFLEARLSSRLTRAVRKPKLGLIVRALFTCRVSQFTNHNDALMICQGWPERWRPRGSGWSSVWGRPGWSWTTETCLEIHHCHRHDQCHRMITITIFSLISVVSTSSDTNHDHLCHHNYFSDLSRSWRQPYSLPSLSWSSQSLRSCGHDHHDHEHHEHHCLLSDLPSSWRQPCHQQPTQIQWNRQLPVKVITFEFHMKNI